MSRSDTEYTGWIQQIPNLQVNGNLTLLTLQVSLNPESSGKQRRKNFLIVMMVIFSHFHPNCSWVLYLKLVAQVSDMLGLASLVLLEYCDFCTLQEDVSEKGSGREPSEKSSLAASVDIIGPAIPWRLECCDFSNYKANSVVITYQISLVLKPPRPEILFKQQRLREIS